MKKLLAVLIACALVFAGCPTDDGNEGNGTTLTIINSSDYNDLRFSYGDADFGVFARGGEVTKTVNAGTRFIYIIAAYVAYTARDPNDNSVIELINTHKLEVNDVFTCEEGKNNQFNFTNNTVVTIPGADAGYRESGGLITGSFKDVLASIKKYYTNN